MHQCASPVQLSKRAIRRTGKCAPTKPNKALGPCEDCTLSIGNPGNAGTGTKYQVENIYSGGTRTPLVERLSYNSRLLADTDAVTHSPLGRGWKGHYDHQLLRALDWGCDPATAERAVARLRSAGLRKRLCGGRRYRRSPRAAGGRKRQYHRLEVHRGGRRFDRALFGRRQAALNRGPRGLDGYADLQRHLHAGQRGASTPGYLIFASDQWGRSLSYVYNAQGGLTRITDPAGGTYDFERDANGNLASITFPDTMVRQFLYNEAAHTAGTALPYSLTGIIDENGARFATYKYDPQGRAVSTEHAGGANKSTLAYTSPFVSTTVTDALNVSRTYGLANFALGW